MSLRHSLLAILVAEPMTGYDLVKHFDRTAGHLWSAPHSQIYPELRRMEDAGLIAATVVPRGGKATKRVYQIVDAGIAELRRWTSELHSPQPERNVDRLKAANFEWASYEAIRRQLQEHLNHFTAERGQWGQMLADIESGSVPLLRRRLEHAPTDQHEAVIAFRRLAFSGQLARAEAEITWARQGLALVDYLESRGASLADGPGP